MRQFERSSSLRERPDVVWRHATSPAGVNRELRPLLTMTFPPDVEDLVAAAEPGKKAFRSWLLLGGILPVEYDDVTFVEVEPGRRFLERSRLLSQRVWEHERIVEPEGEGCRLTDRLGFEPRIPGTGALYAPIFRLVFRVRHRNLRRLFG